TCALPISLEDWPIAVWPVKSLPKPMRPLVGCLSGITCRTYLMSSTLRANNSAPVNLRPLKSVPNRNWLHPMKIRHRTKQCCDVVVAVGLGCSVWLRVAPGTVVMLATQRRLQPHPEPLATAHQMSLVYSRRRHNATAKLSISVIN